MIEDQYIIGFKGFDSNLKCRGFQYEIGKTYEYSGGVDTIKIGQRGYHFCTNLKHVFNFYSPISNNRFCLVRAKHYSGINYTHSDKSVTDEITILEEIPFEVISQFKEYHKQLENDPEMNFRLDEVKIIQKVYPHFILGGSTALYLHGFNIKRNYEVKDLDFVTPYYTPININDFDPEDGVIEADNMSEAQPSGNDFDYVEGLVIGDSFLLLDMRIDPKQRYEIITYNGFDYKVSPWYPIIEAKMRYAAVNRDQKHKKDLVDMFQLVKPGGRVLVNPIESYLNKHKS